MDKKGLSAVILAAIALFAFQFYQAKQNKAYQIAKAAYDAEMAQRAEAEAKANPKPATASGTAAANPQAPVEAASSTAGASAPAPAPAAEEKTDKLSTSAAEYVFTNLGGGISQAKLLNHLVDTKSHANVVLNEFSAIPIGAISEAAGEKTALPYHVTKDDAAGTITFDRVDERQFAVSKKFTLPKTTGLSKTELLREEYSIGLQLTFTNKSDKPVDVPKYWLHAGGTAPIHEKDAPLYIGVNYVRGTSNKFVNSDWFSAGGFPFYRAGHDVYPDPAETMQDVRWAAVANQYFSTMLVPRVDENASSDVAAAQRGVGVWARRTNIAPEAWTKTGRFLTPGHQLHGVEGALQLSGFTLAPGQSVTRDFRVLAGPSEYRRLSQFNDYETEILDFGTFGLISKGLLRSLNGLKSFLGTYWAAIMVLTIIIRSCMWPLQNRATQTAKKMQALSPKLKEIQDKYKDDPMRLQQETGKLWKQHGVNPLGGCLPMLVQIPIFFGFYNMLNRAVELRNNGFLWVHDLSQPDTVGHLFSLPINVLPLVMAGTMLLQMQLTPKAGDPAQQKLMMFMPLIFIGLCYNYAAALALYWSVQNLFSIVQLWVTRDKQAPAVEVIPPPKPKKNRT